MKKSYDVKAKPKEFHVGQWVSVYSPRRFLRRSPKWQKSYGGPYLIVRRVGAVNYTVQKTRKSKPVVTHIDKMKLVRGETPRSWLSDREEEHDVSNLSLLEGAGQVEEMVEAEAEQPLGVRRRTAPRWMADFVHQ